MKRELRTGSQHKGEEKEEGKEGEEEEEEGDCIPIPPSYPCQGEETWG